MRCGLTAWAWCGRASRPIRRSLRRARLDAFERDPAKNARHVLKVLLVFVLLERGSMPAADLPGYVGRVATYRDLSGRFLGLDDDALARWLLDDLQRGGAVTLRDGLIKPTMAA